MIDLPLPVAKLVNMLAEIPNTVAVVLGGSRALGMGELESDWDIGVYYRGNIDLAPLEQYGHVYPPGVWGRLMNGGAWLNYEGERIDVLLRDIEVVEHWSKQAEQGIFEVDNLLGYLAGAPTYLLTAELASCVILRGDLPTPEYPANLVISAPARWRYSCSFSLRYARSCAKRGNLVGALGNLAKALMEEGHAILCEHQNWVCNEKRLLEFAGLADLFHLFGKIPSDPFELVRWVDQFSEQIGGVNNDCRS